MEERNHFALQVIRVHGASNHAKDATFYVEVKFTKAVRKTGILNDEGEPVWNGTFTFSKHEVASVFKIRLKKVRKLGPDDLVGEAEVVVDELLADSGKDNVRVSVFSPTRFLSSRKRQSSTGSIHLHLKTVDALERAKIEIVTAEKSTEGIRALTNKTNSAAEAVGPIIEAADVMIDMVDNIAQIHPLFNVSWQATSALYKLVSQQLHTDSELIDLVGKMRMSFDFSKETSDIDDKTKMLKPIMKNLLSETAECSRFVQEYAKYGFLGRMSKLGSGQKIRDYSTRFVECRKELDSVIGLNTAKEVLDIKSQQQLEVLLDPSKSDPSRVSERPRCLDGTRQEYLDPIMEFLFSETSPNILWLTGAAGSGKSTIAVTASDNCGVKTCPPAHMFFEREKSDPSSVVRSIAYMLALHHPSISGYILGALKANKTICSSTTENQFEKLLLEPLHATANSVEGPIVVILDALDECGSVEQRRGLLHLLKTSFTVLPPKVRILVTSRPEGDIMEDLPQNECIRHIELEHGTKEGRHDVDLYIRHEMTKALGKRVPKGKAWDDSLQVLCDAADGLFIWASTAAKMVQGAVNPRRSLEKLADDVQSVGGNGTDSLYATILKGSGIWEDNADSKDEGTAILGLILVSKEAMTDAIIEVFLGLEEDTVDFILRRLRSVVSYEPGSPIRLHHASFADYLLSSGRSGKEPWHIDEVRQKQAVAERCFDIMAEKLHFNICGIESSFLRNSEIPKLDERIADKIPPHLNYACRFWAVHLHELEWSDRLPAVRDKLKVFATVHLLYWLEVLSLTGCFIRIASRALYIASSWTTSIDSELSSFLWTAYRLVATFEYPISQCAPHIYLSAISLWKGESLIADHYSVTHPVIKVGRLGTRTPGQCIKTLNGHTGWITSISASPDGEHIASSSYDQTVRVWSAFSGELISGPFEVNSAVASVAFSPDGKQVVSGSGGGKIHIWDVETGNLVSGPLKTGKHSVVAVAFSQDGKRVTLICDGRVFYYENGDLVCAKFENDKRIKFHGVSSDGKYVSGSISSMIGVWDTRTGKRISAPIKAGYVRSVAASQPSPDGKYLATGGEYGLICIWNVDSGELVSGPFFDKGLVSSVAFSADGNHVVSSGSEIAVWDVDCRKCIWCPFNEHTEYTTSVIFTPDGKRVISGSRDTIRIWDIVRTNIVSGVFEAHTRPVRLVSFSPDGKRIVSGSWDHTIRTWDADSGEHLLDPFKDITLGVCLVIFSPGGKHVISGCSDNNIRIWDADSDRLILGPLYADSVWSIAVSTDGKRIVSGSKHGFIRIWDTDSGRLVSDPFEGHKASIQSVAFSPDGKRVVSGSLDKTICIWDADRGELVLDPLKGHTSEVRSIAFSPDERIVSGSGDAAICIWDAGTGELISGPLKGHSLGVTSVVFSPDGRFVVSGSEDSTICVWVVDTGELVSDPLKGHTGPVWSVAISPDGTRVVSGSEDKTIRIWDVDGESIIPGRGERLAKRNATFHQADTHAGSNDQGTGPAASRERVLSNWTLSKDGWVKGKGGELLTWIPEDMRQTLWRPRNMAVFSCKFSTKLDLLNSPLGENWAKGYPKQPSTR